MEHERQAWNLDRILDENVTEQNITVKSQKINIYDCKTSAVKGAIS